MRRVVAVAAAALLTSPVAVRAAPARTGVWLISRVSARAELVDHSVRFTNRDGRISFGMIAEVEGVGKKQEVTFAAIFQMGRREPVVYGAGAPGCPAGLCSTVFAGSGFMDMRWERTKPVTSAFVVAAVDFDVTIRPARGWRVTPLPATSFRRVLPDDSSTGAQVLEGVEIFHGAEAGGGRHGSVAIATLPCWHRGHGSAELHGGNQVIGQHCPREPSDKLAATAPGQTSWRWEGEAAGTPTFETRLAVIDLPKVRVWS